MALRWEGTVQSMAQRSILVADDDASIRSLLKQLLSDEGYSVAEAATGSEVVENVKAQSPDLVIMDVRMPELDGIEAARRILAERQLPIVMVTAFAEREMIQQASDAGAFGYLLKPFRQDDVLAAITTAQARSTELAEARKEASSLAEALETRRFVERAKGMLMQTENLSEQDAYARMRSASQRTGQPMRAIAEALLATLRSER
jgi:two-component system, response regulator PdtaR